MTAHADARLSASGNSLLGNSMIDNLLIGNPITDMMVPTLRSWVDPELIHTRISHKLTFSSSPTKVLPADISQTMRVCE